MLLSGQPTQLVLPFASSGSKNTIPVASQIGVTPGAASYTDGFPPLTRLAVSAGGVPPYGLDFNGIFYSLSATDRWACAGAGYTYSSAFATDSNIGGYPAGARLVRSDGRGYWLNISDNNSVNPESTTPGQAYTAGWVPDTTNGLTSVTMTSANVTLTPLQYGNPLIIITGTLTANVNLIFPTMFGKWTVVNSTTGAHTITCKTAAGAGVILIGGQNLFCDGTNILPINAGFTNLTTISATGNFVVPSNIYLLDVELWGGGGGGGTGSVSGSGGGGGAGGYSRGIIQVVPGQVIAATIGLGGAGGDGGGTAFSTLGATGGGVGSTGAGGSGGGGGAGTGGAGSILNYASQYGVSGLTTGLLGGTGGNAAGGGGCGGPSISGGARSGTIPGGGGGGGSSSTGLGAAGAAGVINVRY